MNAPVMSPAARIVRQWPLPLILLCYLWLASGYALETPPWQVPDEPAHYNNVLQRLAGTDPVIEAGDYPFARLEVLKAANWSGVSSKDIEGIEYEDHQPPLYYVLAAALLGGGDVIRQIPGGRSLPLRGSFSWRMPLWIDSADFPHLLVLRLLGVLLGALTVLLAWAVADAVAPMDLPLRVGVTAFAAFLPMQLVLNASVNNDPLTFAITAAALLLALRRGGGAQAAAGWRGAVLPGLLIGLAALTKLNALLPVVVVLVAAEWLGAGAEVGHKGLLCKCAALQPKFHALAGVLAAHARLMGRLGRMRPVSLGRTAVMLMLGLLLASPWLGHNIRHYGWRDPLALVALDQATACSPGDSAGCQPHTADWIAAKGVTDLLERGLVFTFESFWGVFGWMAVFLGRAKGIPIYGALALSSLVALAGAGWMLQRRHRWPEWRQVQALILALHLGVSVGGFLWYNLTYVQHQGRYLLPALLPIALVYCVGLRAAVSAVAGGLGLGDGRGRSLGNLVLLAHSVGLVGLAWLSLRSYIIPGLGG